MIKTVLFDLDGTLVDTEPAAALAIRETFESWGIQVKLEDARFITGRTWEVAFEYLFQKYSIPVGREAASAAMIDKYREALCTHLKLVPGGADAVRALSQKYPLALVSGSHRKEIFFALDQLKVREHFKVVLGAEDYENSKPSPEGYLKAVQMLGADPSHTLVFEDSEAGISSARAANLWVVAIESTNHFGQDTSHAHEKIKDLTEINVAWIEAFRSRQPASSF